MALKIFNSKTQKKETFQSIEPGVVRMYVCGPTVYDYLHVGNFRGPVFFNMVRNHLENLGNKVNFVYNYTDVDDKIIQRGLKENRSANAVAEQFIAEFEADYNSLGLGKHTSNPKVSDYIAAIVAFVDALVKKSQAYVLGGDVYYDVMKFSDYGQLSRKSLEDLEAGYRIDINQAKRHSADFALWKSAKEGELSWPSPWGQGRPGWHIECSAMIKGLLGDHIDIHGGGLDLIFPHHENEVAQSVALSGRPFVNWWMHHNLIQFGSQKMSKSIGNIVKARDFLGKYNAEIFKFLIFSSHYRSVLDFSEASVNHAISGLSRLYSAMAFAKTQLTGPLTPLPESFEKALHLAAEKIQEALNDDFNTPEVFAELFGVTRLFNQLVRLPGRPPPEAIGIAEAYYHFVVHQGKVMALFGESPGDFLLQLDDLLLRQKGALRQDIQDLVDRRSSARAAKDFKTADELRVELVKLGIQLQDRGDRTHWEVDKGVIPAASDS